jgi:hypothetical protein
MRLPYDSLAADGMKALGGVYAYVLRCGLEKPLVEHQCLHPDGDLLPAAARLLGYPRGQGMKVAPSGAMTTATLSVADHDTSSFTTPLPMRSMRLGEASDRAWFISRACEGDMCP